MIRRRLRDVAVVLFVSAVGLGIAVPVGQWAPDRFVVLYAWQACGFAAVALITYHLGVRVGWRRGWAACVAADRAACQALAAGRAAARTPEESPCTPS